MRLLHVLPRSVFSFLLGICFWVQPNEVSGFTLKIVKYNHIHGVRKSSIFPTSPISAADTSCCDLEAPSKDHHQTPMTIDQLDPWLAKVLELSEYKQKYGNTLVPRRYPENQPLSNFVHRQRRLYHHVASNSTNASQKLTPSRVDILNRLGFVWNATLFPSERNINPHRVLGRPKQNEDFWAFHSQLKRFIQKYLQDITEPGGKYSDPESKLLINKECAIMMAMASVRPSTPLGHWLSRQRKDFKVWTESGNKSRVFTEERKNALSNLDPYWHLAPRDRTWRMRYMTLVAYKSKYGDTAVPISFVGKQLANWVFNQRRNYKLKMAGKPTTLTDERLALLQQIEFVWSKWERDFFLQDQHQQQQRSLSK